MTEPAGTETLLVHATCVALGKQGVLLRGASGSGKSDLALRLIDRPGRGVGATVMEAGLVADDQVVLTRNGDDLIASAPGRIAGLLEVRGLGLVRVAPARAVRLALVVDLEAAENIERYPVEKSEVVLLGCAVARVAIDASAPSAPARVRAALAHVVGSA